MNNDSREWKKNPEARKKLIEKMARLLQEGHKMLDEVCPRCDAILFLRKDLNLRYCPNCDIFLASPAELEKLKREDIRIIGEFSGGRIIEYGDIEKQKEAEGPHVKIMDASIGRVMGRGDVATLLDGAISSILKAISENLKVELRRLTIKDLFELLKVVLEIRKNLRD